MLSLSLCLFALGNDEEDCIVDDDEVRSERDEVESESVCGVQLCVGEENNALLLIYVFNVYYFFTLPFYRCVALYLLP